MGEAAVESSSLPAPLSCLDCLNGMTACEIRATPRTVSTLLLGLVRNDRADDAAAVLTSLALGQGRLARHPTLEHLLTPEAIANGSLTFAFNVVIGGICQNESFSPGAKYSLCPRFRRQSSPAFASFSLRRISFSSDDAAE